MNGKLLKVKDVQKRLNISRDKAYALVKLNSFPSFQIDATYYTPEDRLEEWISKVEEEVATAEPVEEKVEQYLQVDPIEVEIGYGLISLVDEKQGGSLFQKISSTFLT